MFGTNSFGYLTAKVLLFFDIRKFSGIFYKKLGFYLLCVGGLLEKNSKKMPSACTADAITLSSKMRKFCNYFLILTYFFTFPAYKITTFPLTHQIIPHIFYSYPLFFVLNQYSLHKKRRSPALNPFVLGCQRRVALPTKTKDYPRIVIN